MIGAIVHGDALQTLRALPDGVAALVYLDPPFNTGRAQRRRTLRTERDPNGDRAGFGGHRYQSETLAEHRFDDQYDDYVAFLEPHLREVRRVLRHDGSLFLHLDPREAHYAKVRLDALFGRASFQNEIVWAYDYGGRSRRRWPAKHDTILWYAVDPKRYVFRYDDIDRIPYRAPGLVTAEKAALGKVPTDVWWQTIVSPTGSEKTGYPTQKPLAILERIVRVHSNPGDLVVDVFAGSGTTAEAAARSGRRFLVADENPEAIEIMTARLARFRPRLLDVERLRAEIGGGGWTGASGFGMKARPPADSQAPPGDAEAPPGDTERPSKDAARGD
jgi:site-specific DNA-methyltransferase (adenine-specific)